MLNHDAIANLETTRLANLEQIVDPNAQAIRKTNFRE